MKILNKSVETSKKSTVSKKISNTPKTFFSVKETADFLGKSEQTITNWCKEGKLQGQPYDFGTKTSYRIPNEEVLKQKLLLDEKKKIKEAEKTYRKLPSQPHTELIDPWDRFCEQGLMGGRPYSDTTREVNKYYLEKFLQEYGTVCIPTVKTALGMIPTQHFAKREKIWSVTQNFYKYLVQEGMGHEEELALWKKYKPKRHQPAKRHVLTEDQVLALESACKTSYERTLITLLANTGLRAHEFAGLKRSDINLDPKGRKELKVIGKWGKERRVGLNSKSVEVLEWYLSQNPRTGDDPMFLNDLGNQLDVNGIQMRLRRIGNRAGIKVHAHALRRAFVTINANKGRSLVTLQILCGHADITTTRDYCQTSMDEAVAQSSEWD